MAAKANRVWSSTSQSVLEGKPERARGVWPLGLKLSRARHPAPAAPIVTRARWKRRPRESLEGRIADGRLGLRGCRDLNAAVEVHVCVLPPRPFRYLERDIEQFFQPFEDL